MSCILWSTTQLLSWYSTCLDVSIGVLIRRSAKLKSILDSQIRTQRNLFRRSDRNATQSDSLRRIGTKSNLRKRSVCVPIWLSKDVAFMSDRLNRPISDITEILPSGVEFPKIVAKLVHTIYTQKIKKRSAFSFSQRKKLNFLKLVYVCSEMVIYQIGYCLLVILVTGYSLMKHIVSKIIFYVF